MIASGEESGELGHLMDRAAENQNRHYSIVLR